MSTIRLTIALSAFLIHIDAHVCRVDGASHRLRPDSYTNTKLQLTVYRRLLTIARMKNPNPGKANFRDTLRARALCISCGLLLVSDGYRYRAHRLVMPLWRSDPQRPVAGAF